MNYDEKQVTVEKMSEFFLSFRKHVSYGFPIINFCIPGLHYETPCVYIYIYIYCGVAVHLVNRPPLPRIISLVHISVRG